ncbi:MAG: glycoside hydrolase family 25 protein [Clostridia bacterium]|nr:glycoside hydrolase family 25 protein [Clostridia bacterium]
MKKNKRIALNKFHIIYMLVALALVICAIIAISLLLDRTTRIDTEYTGLKEEKGFPMAQLNVDNMFYDEYNFRSYEDEHYKSRRGIDVSEHQGYIDWEKVKDSGVQFAFIRLGFSSYDDGSLHMDTWYEDNISRARDAGIDVGVYFFSQATTVEEAIEEARFVIEHLPSKLEMPVAFDMEPVTDHDRIAVLGMREKTEIADAFCSVIEKNGYKSIIYGNPTWIYSGLNLSLLSGRELWLAHYTFWSGFPYEYAIWQYSSEGTLEGISTSVDLNMQLVRK